MYPPPNLVGADRSSTGAVPVLGWLLISRARTGQFVQTADAEDGTLRVNNIWVAELPLREYPD